MNYGPLVKRSKTPPFHGGNMGSIPVWVTIFADVAELADALDLGSSALRRAGSTPVICTKRTLVISTRVLLFYL